MIWIIVDPNIWAGASYPNVITTLQVGRSEKTRNLHIHNQHNKLPPILAEGRGGKREAVSVIFLDSAALWRDTYVS